MSDNFGTDFFIAMVGAVLGGIVVGIITSTAVNLSWQNDCEKLGQTRSSGKVYECRLKDSK